MRGNLLTAQFRKNGVVSVNLEGQSRRYLTNVEGMRDALSVILERTEESRAQVTDLLNNGVVVSYYRGALWVAQVFEPCDVDLNYIARMGDGARVSTYVERLTEQGVLVSHTETGNQRDGTAGINALIKVRAPMRMWAAPFRLGKHDGIGTHAYLYLLSQRPTDIAHLQTVCHGWPAGNVHEDGHICWGGVLRSGESFASLQQMDKKFLTSPFNNDLLRQVQRRPLPSEGYSVESDRPFTFHWHTCAQFITDGRINVPLTQFPTTPCPALNGRP